MVAALAILPRLSIADPDTNTLTLDVVPDFAGGSGFSAQSVAGVGLLSLSGAATGGFNSSGDGSSSVTYGVIKMKGEFFGSGDTESTGTYNDLLTITSPNVANGTQGMLTYWVSVGGTLSSQAGASGAGFTLTADLGGGFNQIDAVGNQYSPDLGGFYQGDPLGLYQATTSFTYGVATALTVSLTGGADAAYSISEPNLPEADYDLAHSCYWQGITNVTANGVAVDNFVVTSDSGADYSHSLQSTPEPATFAPLVFGLLFWGRRKRRG